MSDERSETPRSEATTAPVNSKSRIKRIAAMKSETYRCEQCGGRYRDEQLLTHRCKAQKPAKPKRHRHHDVVALCDTIVGPMMWCPGCGALHYATRPSVAPRWHYPKEER